MLICLAILYTIFYFFTGNIAEIIRTLPLSGEADEPDHSHTESLWRQ